MTQSDKCSPYMEEVQDSCKLIQGSVGKLKFA